MKKSEAERLLLDALNEVGLYPEAEYKFTPAKRWRFDLAFVDIRLAIEIDGSGPGHNSDGAAKKDAAKRNAAIELGWRVLVYPAGSVSIEKRRIRIVAQIQRVFCDETDEDEFPFILTGEWGD